MSADDPNQLFTLMSLPELSEHMKLKHWDCIKYVGETSLSKKGKPIGRRREDVFSVLVSSGRLDCLQKQVRLKRRPL